MMWYLGLLFLAAVACADNVAYNYLPIGQANQQFSFAPAQINNAFFIPQTLDVPIQQDVFPIEHTPSYNPQDPAPAPNQPEPTQATAQYEKQFYTYSAPEEAFDDTAARQHIDLAVKKNLRVLFIKAPSSNGLEKAALNLIHQSSQDHTAIYVLAKQPDIGSLAQQLQTLKSQSQNKPEVHFVKYRTPEDAANAQRAIQEQYNTLPGSSQSVNGGQAQVLDIDEASGAVVSTRATLTPPASVEKQYLAPSKPTPTKGYLPSSLRRRYRS